MAQGPEQTESCLTPALGLLGFCVAFPFPAHLPPHIVCILYGSPETQLRPQLIREPFSPAVCSGGRHTSPYRVSALFPWSGLLLMGGPDTIHLAGNEPVWAGPGSSLPSRRRSTCPFCFKALGSCSCRRPGHSSRSASVLGLWKGSSLKPCQGH